MKRQRKFWRSSLPEDTQFLCFIDHADASSACAVSKTFLALVLCSFLDRPFLFANKHSPQHFAAFRAFINNAAFWQMFGEKPKKWLFPYLQLPQGDVCHDILVKSHVTDLRIVGNNTILHGRVDVFGNNCSLEHFRIIPRRKNAQVSICVHSQTKRLVMSIKKIVVDAASSIFSVYAKNADLHFEDVGITVCRGHGFYFVNCNAHIKNSAVSATIGLETCNSITKFQDTNITEAADGVRLFSGSRAIFSGKSQVFSHRNTFYISDAKSSVALLKNECVKNILIKTNRIDSVHRAF